MSSLSEVAKTLTANAARAGSLDRYSKLSVKLHVLADQEISTIQSGLPPCACQAGCNFCCRSLISATVPELVEISGLVRGWSDERQLSLNRRTADYAFEAAKYWRGENPTFDVECPFLEQGICSIYSHRPLQCRSRSSYDPSACLAALVNGEVEIPEVPGQSKVGESLVDGVVKGFQEAGRAAGTFELAPAVIEILAREEMRLPRKYQIRPGAAGEIPHRRDLMQVRLEVETLYDRHTEMPGSTQLSPIFELELPVVYSSPDRMEESWRILNQRLDRVCESNFDPAEAFQALMFSGLFYLPYSDRNVKPFLQRFMNFAEVNFVRPAFPELTRPLLGPRKPGRFRLGYLSRRLTNYNGSRWALGWLAHQSPEIETYAFNLDVKEDAVSLRWRRLVDHYFHATAGAPEVAHFVRSLDLDALIFTDPGDDGPGLQLSLFRLARWQMTAWGRAITSGSPQMDFYLSSDEMEPDDGDAHYTERLIRLPGSALYLEPESVKPSIKTRADLGLPSSYYFIAQNPSKLLPTRDWIWREITERTGKSVLICNKVSEERAGEIVLKRMEAAGVNVRLIPRMPLADFLRTAQLADAVLDSFDFGGGISTIQILGASCSIISCPGRFMRSRMALPFLRQAGAEGLIARDEEDYIDLACDSVRIAAASANINPAPIYRDLRTVRALDEFLLSLGRDRA